MTALRTEPVFPLPGASPLAARFVRHLREIRGRLALPTGYVAVRRPAWGELADDDLVWVAHLVATIDASGRIGDRAVWERLPAAGYRAWLAGAPVPDRAVLEAAVPGLLRLRAVHREGRLPELGLTDLAALLDGRYLSARIAHQHPQVVLAAVARAAAHRPSLPHPRLTESC
ncbi:hypothetical protein [Pseudofrankia sp. DC12]|uniref:hypothetical protein n=1 Tax=Pseudofrankia sp. DC12 TaxID=683315 RepID=UPI0006986F88|nr:hypothetical protein [Pseudofrankia sp. DC12]